MRAQQLLGICLVSFQVSLAAHIPPDHVLWGPKGPPGATLIPRASPTPSTSTPALLEERDPVCTNSPDSRDCWFDGFSVATDFDKKWPTTNNTNNAVHYDLEITNTTCSPDGHSARTCLLVNGQYPGPTIQANWGDTLSVTVTNSMQDNGTGIHWHGLRQLGTVGMDGVDGITECPLAPGKSKTYTFRLTQHGTTWYHSHLSAQYGDGLLGALVINGPTTSDYDVDLGSYTVTDWFYQSAFVESIAALNNLQQPVGPAQAPPVGDNILINGTNKNANGGGAYGKVSIVKGKKYLLRLINTSMDAMIRVSLDGHRFTVVASDLVPITPYTTDWVLLGIGQRYNVIFTANQTVDNYWFRAKAETACRSNVAQPGLSIFSYEGAVAGDPTSSELSPRPANCLDESPLKPFFQTVVPSDTFNAQVKSLEVEQFNQTGVVTNGKNIVSWGINFTAIDVDWEDPTYSYVINHNTSYPSTANLIQIEESIWTFWIIQETTQPAIPHPIHLHGHDFFVLGAQENAIFDRATSVTTLNFNNPPRRDVAMLPSGGYLVIAFPTDNPGAWLMHCHIAFHISEGLGVQFLEGVNSIPAPPADYNNVCADWKSYYDGNPAYKKDDSGL
ncbi:hypothetical protein MMC29_004720 [Sticta canariensis]|nr:hypothetical protein [Sticta canariensis]